MIIGFSTTNGILSRIIKWATRSRVSHTYILVDIAGEPIAIHSNQHGVNCDHYSKFQKDQTVIREFDLLIHPEDEKKALALAFKLLDRPYDFLSVVGFAWVLLNKAFGRKTGNPLPNRSAYYCSEFALAVLKKAGLGALTFREELVSPEGLMAELNNHSKAVLK